MSPEKRLSEVNSRARGLLYLAVSTGFFAAALFAGQAILLSSIVNRVFLEGQPLGAVAPLLAVALTALLVRAGLIWTGDVLAQRSASRIKGNLRQQLTTHIFTLGPAYTRGERSGELVNAMVEGIEALDEYMTQFLPARYLAGLVPISVFLLVLVLDPPTTLVLLFSGPMLLLLLAFIGGRARAITSRRFLEMSWMSAFFLDVLQGLSTLKMFGRSKEQAANIEDISRHYGHTTMEVLTTAFQTSLVMEWAATAATAMVALEVSLRQMNGLMPFDRALAVLLLTPEFFVPLRQFAVKYHAGTAGQAAAQRIFAILDTPLPSTGSQSTSTATALPTGTHGLTSPPTTAAEAAPLTTPLRFENVSYAYDSGQRPALRSFSLTIRPGQTVALVGPTGAGKTTVSSLLLRFIDPDSGQITAGGVPLELIDRALWRDQVAWVPQLPYLFEGTVADNIRLAQPASSLHAVIAAARAAHADEFIQALPKGYDTPLGERGARLSGGQRQRIAIARAFLKDAPLLILDEVTAHLDATSEALIQAALTRLMADRTVLIIAHRLKLAYGADQVVVMDGGRAVETGTHQALLSQDGLYRRLVTTYETGS